MLPLKIFDIQTIDSPSGMLGILEASKHVGFDVKRVYFIQDVPNGHRRGAHAHKTLKQCFVCLRGSVTIEIRSQGDSQIVELSSPSQAMVLQPGCWRDLQAFSNEALLLVLASAEYDESDYIRDYDEFRRWEAEKARIAAVPYLDLTRETAAIGFLVRRAVEKVVDSGNFIGGPVVTAFEDRFAAYCGAAAGVGLANGLQALTLALRTWGIGRDDEVIVPAHTFVATALAVTEVGATPILVDVEYDTGLLDVNQIAAAISPRTKAIIPVHLYGHPVDMDPLIEIAEAHGLFVLEDAAQAHGATYKGRRCGTLGHAAAFSFYPTKNLGALGDAGGLTTNDLTFASKVRQFANYGASRKYVHDVAGTNSRLDPVQAAVLSVKLDYLEDGNERRRLLAERYLRGLSDVKGILLPAIRKWANPVWHVFPIRIPDRRDEIDQALRNEGIGTNLHYPLPIHLQPCYKGAWNKGEYPVAERLGAELLSLPLQPTHTDVEIDHVIDVLKRNF